MPWCLHCRDVHDSRAVGVSPRFGPNASGLVISQPVLCRAFIGRADELEHLAERRRAAAAGRGGAVLVAGEAGIGKSRLLEQFRRSLPKRTTRVAVTAC